MSLLAHYTFNDQQPITADSSGNGYNATIQSPGVFVTGVTGKANDYALQYGSATVADLGGIDPIHLLGVATPVSFMAWVYLTNWTGGNGHGVSVVSKGMADSIGFVIDPFGNLLFLTGSGVPGDWSSFASSSGVVSTYAWNHVAATWDGVTVKYYINGKLDVSYPATATVVAVNESLYIGDDGFNDTAIGILDEVRIYNDLQTAADIFNIYGGSLYGSGNNMNTYLRP